MPYHQDNSGWIINLNVTAKIIKLLELCIGDYLCKLRGGKNDSVKAWRALNIKENMNKLDFVKLKCSDHEKHY